MSQSKITLIGFNNYLASNENTNLFSKMVLPEGINKDIVCDNILLRGGEFETLISNPFVLRDAIGVWSYKWNWTFNRWLKAINTEYNPLENYNRTETWTDTEDGINEDKKKSVANSEMASNKATEETNVNTSTNTGTTTDHSEGNGSVENTKSAFNSSDYEPYDKSININETDATTTVNSAGDSNTVINGNDNIKTNSSNIIDDTANGSYNKKATHNAHISGNIGVTTSQQMLQSEIDVAMFNLYDRIADLFLQEFVIPIY